MALNVIGITSAIAGMAVSGVTITDILGIPQNVNPPDCPVLFPQPSGWNGGASAAQETTTTFGTATTRYWQVSRTLNYIFLYSAVGSGRGNADNYAGASQAIDALIEKLLTLDMSGVDVETVAHTALGVVEAPNKQRFTGCEFSVTVRERINA